MGQINSKHFEVKLRKEEQYYRLYVTHPNFKERIRKRMGDRSYIDLPSCADTIRDELGKYLSDENFTKYDVESYRAQWISEYPEFITFQIIWCTLMDFGYGV